MSYLKPRSIAGGQSLYWAVSCFHVPNAQKLRVVLRMPHPGLPGCHLIWEGGDLEPINACALGLNVAQDGANCIRASESPHQPLSIWQLDGKGQNPCDQSARQPSSLCQPPPLSSIGFMVCHAVAFSWSSHWRKFWQEPTPSPLAFDPNIIPMGVGGER